MLGSDKMLDHPLFLRSFLDQAEVCDPLIQARGHKNVHTTGLILWGVELAERVPGVNPESTLR